LCPYWPRYRLSVSAKLLSSSCGGHISSSLLWMVRSESTSVFRPVLSTCSGGCGPACPMVFSLRSAPAEFVTGLGSEVGIELFRRKGVKENGFLEISTAAHGRLARDSGTCSSSG